MNTDQSESAGSTSGEALIEALEAASGSSMEIIARVREDVADATAQYLLGTLLGENHDQVLLVGRDRSLIDANTPANCNSVIADEPSTLSAVTFLYPDGSDVLPEDKVVHRVMRGEAFQNVRRIRTGADGEVRHLSISGTPIRDGSGDVGMGLLIVKDITEGMTSDDRIARLAGAAEKQAQEIARSKHRLETIIQSTPVPLLVCTHHMQVVFHNSAALELCEVLGVADWLRRRGNFRELSDAHVLNANGRRIPFEQSPIARALRGEECRGETIRLQFGKGPQRWLRINASPLKEKMAWRTGVVIAAQDVTEDIEHQRRMRDAYRRERTLARKLQTSFLPGECPSVLGFDIAERYHGSGSEAMVGGDFYDVFRLGRGRLGVVMADVAGRGLKSAVYTAMTKYMLRAYALETSAPDLVLARLNEALHECTPPEVFVTLVYGVLDNQGATFTYANAGHEQPALYTCRCDAPYSLDVTGRALALTSGSCYSTRELTMCGGDVLALYTDGITDAGTGTDRFGVHRLLGALRRSAEKSASDIADTIITEAKGHSKKGLVDDAALLIIKAICAER